MSVLSEVLQSNPATAPLAAGLSALGGGKSGSVQKSGRTLTRQDLWEVTGDFHGTVLANNGKTVQRRELAIAVALAESGGVTNARNKNSDSFGSVDRGLWQINSHWHPEVSDACADSPACAARAAYRISKGGSDWSAWSTYNNHAWESHYTGSSKTGSMPNADSGAFGTGIGSPTGIPNPISGMDDLAKALGHRDTWLRIGKVFFGAVALILGVMYFGRVLVADQVKHVIGK